MRRSDRQERCSTGAAYCCTLGCAQKQAVGTSTRRSNARLRGGSTQIPEVVDGIPPSTRASDASGGDADRFVQLRLPVGDELVKQGGSATPAARFVALLLSTAVQHTRAATLSRQKWILPEMSHPEIS